MQKKVNYKEYLFYILLLILPFVQAMSSINEIESANVFILPSFIITASSIVRWVLLSIIIFCSFFVNYKILNFQILKILIMLFVFYLIPFAYSLVSFKELDVYTLLLIQSWSIPLFVVLTFKNRVLNINYITVICTIFLALSFIADQGSFLRGFRFAGFLNNANLYGIIALFFLSVFLIDNSEKGRFYTIFKYFLVTAYALSIILTQSRNALIGLFLIFLFTIRFRISRFLHVIFFLIIVCLFFGANFFHEINFNRLFSFSSAAKQSGREEFWEPAKYYISQQPLWGYGLDKPVALLKTGNVHNNYLRYIFTMGYFFSSICFLFLFIFLIKLASNFKKIPGSILGFIVAFITANYGEDYFVGPGSSALIVFFISIGLSLTFIDRNEIIKIIKYEKR